MTEGPDLTWREYRGINDGDPADDEPTPRHGDAELIDWQMRFIATLAELLTARHFDNGEYEVERLEFADSVLTLVVRVWRRDESGLVGFRRHLPALRGFYGTPDPAIAAGHWHIDGFSPCYLPSPFEPDADGVHWRGGYGAVSRET